MLPLEDMVVSTHTTPASDISVPFHPQVFLGNGNRVKGIEDMKTLGQLH